ncbi:MAG: hypothetical protein ACRENE_01985 [Polyangiaceae bacterium]
MTSGSPPSDQLYVDAEDCARCEHEVRFLGFKVLTLHYRILLTGE